MSPDQLPKLPLEVAPFARFGALCGAAIAAPAILFAADPAVAGAPVGVSTDAVRQVVKISIPADAGYTAIQAQVIKGNLTSSNWFNVPGGILSSNQTSLEIPMQALPASGCFFRGVADRLNSNLTISKEPHGPDSYHIVVTVNDAVLRKTDGSVDPAQLSHWTIQNSTDGVRWSSSGYQVNPGGTQFALRIPANNGAQEPFFMSRIQYVP